MSDITEGKWRYSEYGSEVTISKEGVLVGSERVCSISNFSKDKDEINANGKLIAAAPELLEALIDAKKVLTALANKGQYPLELTQGQKENIGRNGFGFITNAINKATL